jgi:Rieske Fe-S protein
MPDETGLSRRSALRGFSVAVVGGIAGFLVARNSAAARTKSGTTAANAYGAATNTSGRLLAPLDRIPDGAGLILDNPPIVLINTGGQIHAFSAICTHQGCTVDRVANGQIQCPCHGSTFDATTGDVTVGPAAKPLPKIAVEVRAGSVYTS